VLNAKKPATKRTCNILIALQGPLYALGSAVRKSVASIAECWTEAIVKQ
jgi:hypothetical protein